jgi:hypothetical protein
LQKGLLSNHRDLVWEEMEQMSEFISRLESFEYMDILVIQETKINKVLKAILKLPDIPRDEEFLITTRSQTLFDNWNRQIIEQGKEDLINFMDSELRKHCRDQDEEWLRYRLPKPRCVEAVMTDSRVLETNFRQLRAVGRVAMEWINAERKGCPVAYDLQAATNALQRAGVKARFMLQS